MKVSKIVVTRGRKLHLENYDSEHFEIQMESIIEDKDDPQEVIKGIQTLLDRHLDSWEQSKRDINSKMGNTPQISIKTADELANQETNLEEKNIISTKILDTEKISDKEEEQLICPKCNELMVKKDGKDYYLCNKHWGYPDMIKKGQVRDKRY